MADIDPELRDKIIETHTMVGVIVKTQEHHKERLDKHEEKINSLSAFKNRVLGYAFAVGAFGSAAASSIKSMFGGIGHG
jgi:hypothetical protein